MPHVHLNAREWLESQRLQGCEWAPELLDLLEDVEPSQMCSEALEDISGRMPAVVRALLSEGEVARFAERVCDALDILEAVEEISAEFIPDFTHCPNGAPLGDIGDRLRAAFESDRWQKYDL